MYFNPRTPCGVRRNRCGWPRWKTVISIHAPLAGCDGENTVDVGNTLISIHAPLAGCDSSPTRNRCAPRISIHAPLAGCDRSDGRFARAVDISIHAPLAGCDEHVTVLWQDARNFNPRTPCGVRPALPGRPHRWRRFQSTHPLRGATRPGRPFPPSGCYFNPRTPCGVRPARSARSVGRGHFNPRTPCGVRQGENGRWTGG